MSRSASHEAPRALLQAPAGEGRPAQLECDLRAGLGDDAPQAALHQRAQRHPFARSDLAGFAQSADRKFRWSSSWPSVWVCRYGCPHRIGAAACGRQPMSGGATSLRRHPYRTPYGRHEDDHRISIRCCAKPARSAAREGVTLRTPGGARPAARRRRDSPKVAFKLRRATFAAGACRGARASWRRCATSPMRPRRIMRGSRHCAGTMACATVDRDRDFRRFAMTVVNPLIATA